MAEFITFKFASFTLKIYKVKVFNKFYGIPPFTVYRHNLEQVYKK